MAMCLDRAFGRAQRVGDLLVGLAANRVDPAGALEHGDVAVGGDADPTRKW